MFQFLKATQVYAGYYRQFEFAIECHIATVVDHFIFFTFEIIIDLDLTDS